MLWTLIYIKVSKIFRIKFGNMSKMWFVFKLFRWFLVISMCYFFQFIRIDSANILVFYNRRKCLVDAAVVAGSEKGVSDIGVEHTAGCLLVWGVIFSEKRENVNKSVTYCCNSNNFLAVSHHVFRGLWTFLSPPPSLANSWISILFLSTFFACLYFQ